MALRTNLTITNMHLVTIALKHWREILLAVLLSVLLFAVKDYLGQRKHIAALELELSAKSQIVTEQAGQLQAYAAATLQQQEEYKQAEKRRLQVINNLSAQVTNLRQQIVPKDCQSAVDFAIDHKDDLKW